MYREGRVAAPGRAIRCAVYTRKSTDEGLDQAFNSLDAQREACEAYVASQRHEGWTLLPDRYDDGGFSGGTLERPALRRLLGDVGARRVDVIVLYKIDRLTRALSDFARIVEVLDRADASFVSVTQAFNTTTSMGRLTLNVLLSFAQFEREVGAERVRDKIAASKKKGMWMGGVCPLGYDVRDRMLVVNPDEADRVRLIFELYLELGSVLALEAALDRRGIRSKERSGCNGQPRGGKPFSRGALYLMLKNPLYVGEVGYRGETYAGQHEAIVAPATFARVQELLAGNRIVRGDHSSNADAPSLLAGILWDGDGRRMSPSHASKGAKRYRYYTSRSDGSAPQTSAIVRVPAATVEAVAIARLCAFLGDTHAVHAAIDGLEPDAVTIDAVLFAAGNVARQLSDPSVHEQRALLLRLVLRVELAAGEVRIQVAIAALFALAEVAAPGAAPDVTLVAPAKLVRRAREVRLMIPAVPSTTAPVRDAGLIKLLVKAHAARSALLNGGGASLREVAQREGHDPGYFAVLVKLAYLAPDLTAAILDGRQPPELTRQRLARLRDVPMLWDAQRQLLSAA